MKIWYGYGSEHSANLVIIGQFKEVGNAAKAKAIIDILTAQEWADIDAGLKQEGEHTDRFTETMLAVLSEVRVYDLAPDELQHFTYDVTIRVEDDQFLLTTDESDVSAFLKVLLSQGARVEVYSAHHYPCPESASSKSQ